jgi:hypothetical protein
VIGDEGYRFPHDLAEHADRLTAEDGAEVWMIPIVRLAGILMISYSVVAWYKLGLRHREIYFSITEV